MKKIVCLLCLCTALASCEQSINEHKVSGRWYTQSQVELGKKVYAENCIACHNESARGISNWKDRDGTGNYPPPPLNGSAHAWHHPITILKKTIEQGGIPLGGTMPGFDSELSEEETLAVISYFQSFWSEEIYAEWLKRGGLK
jgi:mono/diheme cytochrome c family protein